MAATCSKKNPLPIGRRLGFRSRARSTNSCPIAHRLVRLCARKARPSFYHTWYLKPQGDACLVVTDEVGKGKDAAQLPGDGRKPHASPGHDLWLAALKWTSEAK